MSEFLSKLKAVFGRRQLADDLRDEADAHLQMEVEANLDRGMTQQQALQTAKRNFGNQTLIRESAHEAWIFRSLETLLQDLRYGLRMLLRNPGFTVAVVLCLGLGIGANSAIFSLIEAVLLRTLPVSEPAGLMQVVHTGTKIPFGSESSETTNYDLFRYLCDGNRTLSGLLQVGASSGTAVVDGAAERVQVQRVTGDYYSVLGVSTVAGRTIVTDDSTDAGFRPVAVLGYDYWQRRFGGDPNVIGRSINLNNTPYSVIGVTPQSFFGLQTGERPDITVPLDGASEKYGWYSMAIIGRLRPGVSATQAEAELNGLFQQYMRPVALAPALRTETLARLQLQPASRGLGDLRRRFSKPLIALMIMVSLVLLVACANVGSLLLARAITRRREIAVRLAMGAGKSRISRQLFTEGALLSLLGGTAGLLFAWWSSRLLASLTLDEGLIRVIAAPLNARVLGFTLAVSLIFGMFFSLMPVIRAKGIALASSLAEGRTIVVRSPLLGKVLVVAQLALSLVLLAGAGLFVQSLNNLKSVEMGADGRVLAFSVDAGGTGLEEQNLAALQTELLRRLRSLPGVRDAALTTIPPLSGNEDGKPVAVPGYTARQGEATVAQLNSVTAGYFATFDVQILSGRGLAESDTRSSAKVAVISESLARRYFGTANPVGKRLGFGRLRNEAAGQVQIIGVARNALYRRSMKEPPAEMIYIPYSQKNEPEDTVDFGLRTSGAPDLLTNEARKAVRELAPMALMTQPSTLADQVDSILVLERLLAVLGSVFSLLCLTLTAVGLYGLLAYSVTRRTPEIGIRVALGAKRGRVLWLVLRDSLGLVVAGTAIGIVGALFALRSASSLLFGLTTTDPASLIGATVLLAPVAITASAVPAIRALRIAPTTALRYE